MSITSFQQFCSVCLNDTAFKFIIDDESIIQCQCCTLAYQVHIPSNPTEVYTKINYDRRRIESSGWLSCWNRFHHDVSIGYSRLQQLKHILPEASKGKCLDIGCSNCGFLCAARRLGYSVVGLEADPSFCKEVTSLTGIHVFPLLDCIDAFSLKSMYAYIGVNIITLFDVLEHFVDPIGILTSVARLLKKDGLLIIELPDLDQCTVPIAQWKHTKKDEHLYYFSATSLDKVRERVFDSTFELIHKAIPVKDKLQVVWKKTCDY